MNESSVVRDTLRNADKDKVNIRYRLDFAHILHQKFLLETSYDCSFSQFCRLMLKDAIKPKATDWGTWLCMICINPQLKLEGLKRSIKNKFNGLSIEDLNSQKKNCKRKRKKCMVSYLEWMKVMSRKEKVAEKGKEEGKEEGRSERAVTYNTEKVNLTDPSKNFASKFVAELVLLQEHNWRKVSQYRRIRVIKEIVNNPENRSAA